MEKQRERGGEMEKKKIVSLTPRGLAVVLAIQAGIIPKCEGGYDTAAFDRFWDRYELEVKGLLSFQKMVNGRLNNKFNKITKIGFLVLGFGFGLLFGHLLPSVQMFAHG